MTDQAISPLRRRMMEDMTIPKFERKAQHDTCDRSRTARATSSALPDTRCPFIAGHHGSTGRAWSGTR